MAETQKAKHKSYTHRVRTGKGCGKTSIKARFVVNCHTQLLTDSMASTLGSTVVEDEETGTSVPATEPPTPIKGPDMDSFNQLFPDPLPNIKALRAQDYKREVRRKSHLYGEKEAEVEVMVDLLIREKGGRQGALLYVVSSMYGQEKLRAFSSTELKTAGVLLHLSVNKAQTVTCGDIKSYLARRTLGGNFSGLKVNTFVSVLLHKGAQPHATDAQLWTPLHHAVRRHLVAVCHKLLEHRALPHVCDAMGKSPFALAVQQQDDELGALLLVFMPNPIARSLFISREKKPAEFSFHDLLMSGAMQKTVLSALDCLLDECPSGGSSSRRLRVYYHLLEADPQGHPPNSLHFDSTSKSILHHIARTGNKTLVYHDVVRLLIRRKWKEYAKVRFQLSALLYVFKLFTLTYCAVVACGTMDPMVYDTALQYSRLVMEILACIMISFDFLLELNQMRKQRSDYLGDPFNLLDLSSVSLLLAVTPLRVLAVSPAQWYLYSLGYLLMTTRIFKYAAVFRETGAYTQILWKIVSHDMVQFLVVFAIFVLAFSGAFLLAVRGERPIENENSTIVTITDGVNSFGSILFTGTRTLVEAQPVTEYTGSGTSYKWLSTLLMILYLLTCIVILLNILIAQLSDTYQHIKGDAQRALELNRATIVVRVELNSIFVGKGFRISRYTEFEDVSNPNETLERWEGPTSSDQTKDLHYLKDSVDSLELDLRALKTRMARQDHVLNTIREHLEDLLERTGVVFKHVSRSDGLDALSFINRRKSL